MNENKVYHVDFTQSKKIKEFDYAGSHFKLTSDGVIFISKDKEGNESPRWLCSPLNVIAKTRDANSGEWGRLLEWLDDDNVKHQWAMPLSLLQGDSSDARRELARLGLSISPSRIARDLLTIYIQVFPIEKRARRVEKLGWYEDVFITADKCIGNHPELIVFQNNNAVNAALSVSGTVDEWHNSIGCLAAGNSRLVFALSCAFAPSLAAIAGEDSGGFHLRGVSSCGKSTALKMAASVWGKPSSYTRLWRATANGLEGLASLHNDSLLILDELSQIDPKEAGEAAYLLANGQGKTRASRSGLARQSSNWSLFFEALVLAEREKGYNKYEIHQILYERLQVKTPSLSTIYALLMRHGRNRLTVKMQTEKRIKEKAGELAHIDCYHLAKDTIDSDKKRYYILAVIDSCTRVAWAEVIEDMKAISVMFAALHCFNFFKSFCKGVTIA